MLTHLSHFAQARRAASGQDRRPPLRFAVELARVRSSLLCRHLSPPAVLEYCGDVEWSRSNWKAFVAGMLFSAALAGLLVWMAISGAFNPGRDGEGGWIFEYQSLIGGLLALLAAVLALYIGRRQIRQVERQIALGEIATRVEDKAAVLVAMEKLTDITRQIESLTEALEAGGDLAAVTPDEEVAPELGARIRTLLGNVLDALLAIDRETRDLSILLNRSTAVAGEIGKVRVLSQALRRAISALGADYKATKRVGAKPIKRFRKAITCLLAGCESAKTACETAIANIETDIKELHAVAL